LKDRNGDNPHFTVQERKQKREAEKLVVTTEIVSQMTQQNQFSIGPVEVKVSERIAIVEILMYFDDDDEGFPISGFPRSLYSTKGMRLQPDDTLAGRGSLNFDI
jgi:hypothetical protein